MAWVEQCGGIFLAQGKCICCMEVRACNLLVIVQQVRNKQRQEVAWSAHNYLNLFCFLFWVWNCIKNKSSYVWIFFRRPPSCPPPSYSHLNYLSLVWHLPTAVSLSYSTLKNVLSPVCSAIRFLILYDWTTVSVDYITCTVNIHHLPEECTTCIHWIQNC